MKLTPQQYQAVTAQNRELLVSAAAGSGKTQVLILRILDLIENHGMSVDRMLVVTFTRAAAAEMKGRLESALRKKAEEGNPFMARQADKAQAAQISTIDSFCKRVTKDYFEEVDFDPAFRIGSEEDHSRLRKESMEITLNELYDRAAEGDSDAAFLTACFDEEDIAGMIDRLYTFLSALPNPEEWLEKWANHHITKESFDSEAIAQRLTKSLMERLEVLLDSIGKTAVLFEELEHLDSRYGDLLDSDREMVRHVYSMGEKGLTELVETMQAAKFVKLATYGSKNDDAAKAAGEVFKEAAKKYRNQFKALVNSLPQTGNTPIEDIQSMEPACRALASAVKLFHELFWTAKRDRANPDFNDVAHAALKILHSPEHCRRIASRYDAVFVDEYQDVSRLQDALLSCLREQGVPTFYVGDVKQSIYRFRQAEPALFLGKLDTFSKDADAPCRRIDLNENFRSRTAILTGVNRVFESIIHRASLGLEYDEDAALHTSSPTEGDPEVEIHVMQGKNSEGIAVEIGFVARDILSRLGKPMRGIPGEEDRVMKLGDVAILTPTMHNVGDKIVKELQRYGIPVYSEGTDCAADAPEVKMMVSFLKLLCSPKEDLPLIGTLRSPLFGFTDEELAQIRLQAANKTIPFREAFAILLEKEGSLGEKCREAAAVLEREKCYVSGMPLSEYLWSFLERSGMYARWGFETRGEQRKANLEYLCERAWTYEREGDGTLPGFVERMERERERSSPTAPMTVAPDEDTVRMMTIHKSKGLQFPVVYVVHLGEDLVKKQPGELPPLAVHQDYGMGIRYVNPKLMTKRETIIYTAIREQSNEAEKAERARVLYVAMTRPSVRLVMVGTKKEDCYQEVAEKIRMGRRPGALEAREASTFLDWLLMSADRRDRITVETGEKFSTLEAWKTRPRMEIPTGFPQKKPHLDYFFHIEPNAAALSEGMQAGQGLEERTIPKPLQNKDLWLTEELWESALSDFPNVENVENPSLPTGERIAPLTEPERDPLLPVFHGEKATLKVGVTAYCEAVREGESPRARLEARGRLKPEMLVNGEETPPSGTGLAETADTKRAPAQSRPSALLPETMPVPLFMLTEEELHPKGPAQRGTATHRLLELLRDERYRPLLMPSPCADETLAQALEEDIAEFTQKRLLEDGELVNRKSILSFLKSSLYRRVLQSSRVEREHAFSTWLEVPDDLMVQGIIDLCFLEDGCWVLADYKTDRVDSPEALRERYRDQLAFYRRALEEGTPYRVRETVLYSLWLGMEVRVDDGAADFIGGGIR